MANQNCGKDISHIFTFVGCNLKMLVNIFELDDLDRIFCFEQTAQGIREDVIPLVLQTVNLNTASFDGLGIV